MSGTSSAVRWFGWGALLVATTGTLLTLQREQRHERAVAAPSPDNSFRTFTIVDEGDEAAVQACFDHYSGLASVHRDEDQRATEVQIEADGQISQCLDEANAKRRIHRPTTFVQTPTALYFHRRVDDPWSSPTEPELFPARWYRCRADRPQQFVPFSKLEIVERAAEKCVADFGSELIQVDVNGDGRIKRLMVDLMPPEQMSHHKSDVVKRIDCLVQTVCQYRFESSATLIDLWVMSPMSRRTAAPVLKNPRK